MQKEQLSWDTLHLLETFVRNLQQIYNTGGLPGCLADAVLNTPSAEIRWEQPRHAMGNRGFITPETPPELSGFIHEHVGIYSDLYRIAAHVYAWVTGMPLFDFEGDAQQLVSFILHVHPKSLKEKKTDVWLNLSRILDKCLRKSPNERYQTTFGLLADLNQLRSLVAAREDETFVLGLSDPSRELRQLPVLVGRRREVDAFSVFLDQDEMETEGHLLLMTGPSGAGKSALSRFFSDAARSQKWHVCYVKFQGGQEHSPLRQIIHKVEDFLVGLMGQPAPRRAAWIERAHVHLGEYMGELAARIPALHPFFSWTQAFVKTPLVDGNAEEIFYDGLAKLCSLIVVQEKGVFWIFDDIQWADQSAFEVMSRLARLGQAHPLTPAQQAFKDYLVLCLCRTGASVSQEVQSQKAHNDLDHPLIQKFLLPYLAPNCHMALNPLSRDDSVRLALELLGTSSDSDVELSNIAADLCQGSPLFIKEFLLAALGSGVYNFHAGLSCWEIDRVRLRTFKLSQGVSSLLRLRIERASDDVKVLLGILCVCFFEPTLNILRAMWLGVAPTQGAGFDSTLQTAIRSQFIHIEQERVLFFHDAIREIVADFLPDVLKENSHTSAAITLLKLNSELALGTDLLFACASHVCAAHSLHRDPKALTLLMKAGRQALALFSYQKAEKFAELAQKMLSESENSFGKTEQIHVDSTSNKLNELWESKELIADIYAHTERITSAINIYKFLVKQPSVGGECSEARAKIYAKLCRCELGLFRYHESLKSGIKGLKELGFTYHLGFSALLKAALFVPEFLLRFLLFALIKNPGKRTFNSQENAVLEIMTSVQIAAFYTHSWVAVANHLILPLTRRIFQNEPSRFKSIHLFYWSIALLTLGFEGWARICMQPAWAYFRAHPDPAVEGQIQFSLGYLVDFHKGDLSAAAAAQQEAFEKLNAAGESFYRINSLQALILLGQFGNLGPRFYAAWEHLLSLWNGIQFAPTYLGVLSRFELAMGHLESSIRTMRLALGAAKIMIRQGHVAIDSLYALVSCGETLFLRGKYWQSEKILNLNFRLLVCSLNRVMYPNYGLLILVKTRVFMGRPFSALVPLLFSWFNSFFSMPVLRPYTWIATGHVLCGFRLWEMALWFFRRGLNQVSQREGLAHAEAELCFEVAQRVNHLDAYWAYGLGYKAFCYFKETKQTKRIADCQTFLEGMGKGIPPAQDVSPVPHTPRDLSQTWHAVQDSPVSLANAVFFKGMGDLIGRLRVCRSEEECAHTFLNYFYANIPFEMACILRAEGNDWHIVCQYAWGVRTAPHVNDLFNEFSVPLDFRTILLRTPQIWAQENQSWVKKNYDIFDTCVWNPRLKGQVFRCYVYEGILVLLLHRDWKFIDPVHARDIASLCQCLPDLFRRANDSAKPSEEWETAGNKLHSSAFVSESRHPILLPPKPAVSGTDVCWTYQAEGGMGGDFLDCYFNEHYHRLYMAVGDVTGSGLWAALASAMTAGTIRTTEYVSKRLDNVATWSLSPEEHMMLIAEAVHNNIRTLGLPRNKLLTLSLMSLDVETGELLYMSAGHNAPFLVQRRHRRVRRLMAVGERMGFAASPSFRLHRERLAPGDFLFICTDGLFESSGAAEAQHRFTQHLKALLLGPGNIEEIQDLVLLEAQKYRGGGPALDDIVTLFAHWRSPFCRCPEVPQSVNLIRGYDLA